MDVFTVVNMILGFISSIITIAQVIRDFGRYIAKRKGSSDAATSDKPDDYLYGNQ